MLGLADLDVEKIEKPVKERINEIIGFLASSNDHTILLVDEVPTVHEQGRQNYFFPLGRIASSTSNFW